MSYVCVVVVVVVAVWPSCLCVGIIVVAVPVLCFVMRPAAVLGSSYLARAGQQRAAPPTR